MIRRDLLKQVSLFFGACGLFLVNQFRASGDVVKRLPISSVKQALQLNISLEMTKFVLAQPLQAQSATLQEKLAMLKLIIMTCTRPGAIEQANREKASFFILQNEENNGTNLKYLANGVGRQWIQSNIGAWKNTDLKRIVTKALTS